jgi:uracil-DNA glycosylase family 4
MPTESSLNLNQQLLAHMESLRIAGILFMPRGEPLELPNLVQQPNETAVTPKVRLEVQEPDRQSSPVKPETTAPFFASPPVPPPDTPDGRRHALKMLASEISECNLCGELFSTRTQTVFGVGPIDPDVAFVGEAPGADEDRQGEPFVGRAGQLLDRIIVASGFTRKEVYIFNTLKCRPPNNRPPHASECANCRPYFEQQFELVNPKYVVALGATAAKNLLQTGEGIGSLRGKVSQYRGRPLICTYHPSYLLRDETGTKKRECWDDMKLLLKTMGRPIPEVKRG